jgi:hypothetical protein
MPLAPDLAVRIIPNKKFDWKSTGNSFSNFKYRSQKLNRSNIVNLNRQIYQGLGNLPRSGFLESAYEQEWEILKLPVF